MEQRYRAVLQVQAGVSVTEVAGAFGVSRQAVHRWLRWYRDEGLAVWPIARTDRMSIRGRSIRRCRRRSAKCAVTIPGGGNAGWPLSWAGRAAGPIPSESTIYRVLVRHSFIRPTPRGRRREDYRRWERPEPMQLWLDIVDSSAG